MEIFYTVILIFLMTTYDLWKRYKLRGEFERTIDRMKISESNLRDRELQLLEIIKYLQSNKNIGNKN